MIHEQLWASYLAGEPLIVTLVPDQTARSLQQRLNGSFRRFWMMRGYTLCTRSHGSTVQVWLKDRIQVRVETHEAA